MGLKNKPYMEQPAAKHTNCLQSPAEVETVEMPAGWPDAGGESFVAVPVATGMVDEPTFCPHHKFIDGTCQMQTCACAQAAIGSPIPPPYCSYDEDETAPAVGWSNPKLEE